MTASRSSHRSSARPLLRGVLWALCGLLLAALGVRLTAEMVVDEEYVATRIARSLGARSHDPAVRVEHAQFLPFRRTLTIRGLEALVSEDPSPGPTTAGNGRLHWRLTVPRARVAAIGLTDLFGDGIKARELAMEAPRLSAFTVGGSSGPACRDHDHCRRLGGSTGEPPPAGHPGPDPRLRFERVSVTDGTLGLGDLTPSSPLAGRLNGLDLELTGFEVREGRDRLLPAVLGSVSRLRVPSYLVRARDGGLLLSVRNVALDLGEGTAWIGRVRLRKQEAGIPPAARPRVSAVPADTTELTASHLVLEGVVFDTTGDHRVLDARTLRVDRLRLHVVDGVLPGTGPHRRPPRTPVQHLRSLEGVTGRIDSVRLVRGAVRYTERRAGQPGTGTLLFDRLAAAAKRVPFGSRPNSARDTVRVSVHGRIAEAAPIWLRASFPERSDVLSFETRGGVTSLELPALNSIVRPTEGIEITGGRLDSLRFSLVVHSGHAVGRVTPVYAGLGLSLQDPRTGGSGLDEHLREFVLGLRLNARNHPGDGDDFRTGTIDYRSSPGQTFLAFVWRALFSGLRDVAGI